MIGALLVLAQTALPSIGVLEGDRSVRVSVTRGADAPMVRLDAVRPVLPVTIVRDGTRWTATIRGATIAGELLSPFVRAGGELRQLVASPVLRDGALHVPLQLLAEVLPQIANGFLWDPERRELRAFVTATRSTRTLPAEGRSPSPAEVERPGAEPANREPLPAPRAGRRITSGRRHVVVVDAGHGGPDRGMSGPIGGGPRVYEAQITLAVSKRVGEVLRARGVEVVYTRTTDTLIALSDRGRIANQAKGDLFLSIHVNAANPGWKDPGDARGFETYFLAEAQTEDARRVERMENEAVRFETGANAPRNDPLSFILNDMAQNEHLRESSELAELVQGSLRRIHPGPNRGVKQAGFRVLVTAYMPAVLIEIGFGTNRAEAAWMSESAEQERLAEAIADATIEYLERYDRRVRSSGADR